MKTILLILGGQIPAHDYPGTDRVLTALLSAAGYATRTIATSPEDADLAGVSTVVIFTDGDFFTNAAIHALKAFVQRGGGLITLHTAASTNKDSAVLAELVGARQVGGVVEPHTAYIIDPAHPITAGLSNFELDDEIHQLKPAATYHVLVDASLIGIRQPLVFVKQTGDGTTVHFATGHKIAGITHPTWQELFRRAVAFVTR